MHALLLAALFPLVHSLLGLHAAGVCDQKGPVVAKQCILDLLLALLIHICTAGRRAN